MGPTSTSTPTATSRASSTRAEFETPTTRSARPRASVAPTSLDVERGALARSLSAMIYLDHAASTPMRPEAIAAMMPFLADHPANPSGSHQASREAKTALEAAREDVADVLGCAPNEIVFTGSGSESDNLAVKGTARAARARGVADGVIVSAI